MPLAIVDDVPPVNLCDSRRQVQLKVRNNIRPIVISDRLYDLVR